MKRQAIKLQAPAWRLTVTMVELRIDPRISDAYLGVTTAADAALLANRRELRTRSGMVQVEKTGPNYKHDLCEILARSF